MVLKIGIKQNFVNQNWTKAKILDIAEMDSPTYLLNLDTLNLDVYTFLTNSLPTRLLFAQDPLNKCIAVIADQCKNFS